MVATPGRYRVGGDNRIGSEYHPDFDGRRPMKKLAIVVAALLLVPNAGRAKDPCSWTMYGHDARHSFRTCSVIDRADVARLAPKWFFHTTDSVTASPAVDDGTVYVGTWAGTFF